MNPLVHQIAREYKSDLQKLYGSEFNSLILFGSYARGDYHEESDIDFALILNKESVRGAEEIFRTSKLRTALELKYGVAISILSASKSKLERSLQGVYQSIRKEGMVI